MSRWLRLARLRALHSYSATPCPRSSVRKHCVGLRPEVKGRLLARQEGLVIVQYFILYQRYQHRDPGRHKGDHGGEVPFAYCTHPLGDCERAEY